MWFIFLVQRQILHLLLVIVLIFQAITLLRVYDAPASVQRDLGALFAPPAGAWSLAQVLGPIALNVEAFGQLCDAQVRFCSYINDSRATTLSVQGDSGCHAGLWLLPADS